FKPLASANGRRNDLRIRECGFAELLANLAGDIVDLTQITFCERDHDPLYTEIKQNLQMLFRLRHPSVVGGNNEKREINRANAGDHVANEIFMTRHINNADVKCFSARSSEI